MRLSTVCVWALATAVVVGLAAALPVQAELAQPELQFIRPGAQGGYAAPTATHIAALAVIAPFCSLALALAVVAEARSSGAARMGAVIALGGGPLLAVLLVAGILQAGGESGSWWNALSNPELLVLLQAAGGLAALVLIAVMSPMQRVVAIVFAALSGVALLMSLPQQLTIANAGVDTVLHDTYYVLAAKHQAGVAVSLNMLGALTAWSIRWAGVKRAWFSLVVGVGALATGAMAAMTTAQLGLMGMPIGYVEYPPSFAPLHAAVAMWWTAFAVVLAASAGGLAVLMARDKRPPGVEAAFD